MIPGIGNVAGAALGGAIAGATKKGGNAFKNALGGAASGAALGGVGGAVGGGIKTIASQGLKAGLKQAGQQVIGNGVKDAALRAGTGYATGGAKGAATSLLAGGGAPAASGGGGGLSSIFGGGGGAGGMLSKIPWGDVAQLGVGALGAMQSAKDARRGDQLRNQASDIAMAEYQAGAPLRDRARMLALQAPPPREDLSALFRSENPFANR